MEDEKINCPYCGEKIIKGAIKCKHCKEWIGAKPSNNVVHSENNCKKSRINVASIVVLTLIPVLVIFLLLFYWIPRTPEYSLYQISKAFTRHDFSAFQEYVDVNSTANSLVEALIEKAKASNLVVNATQVQLHTRTIQDIRHLVENKDNKVFNTDKVAVKLPELVLSKKVGILQIKNLKYTANQCDITMLGKDKNYPFHIIMTYRDGRWIVTKMKILIIKPQLKSSVINWYGGWRDKHGHYDNVYYIDLNSIKTLEDGTKTFKTKEIINGVWGSSDSDKPEEEHNTVYSDYTADCRNKAIIAQTEYGPEILSIDQIERQDEYTINADYIPKAFVNYYNTVCGQ